MSMRDRTALFLRYREEASILHRSKKRAQPSEEVDLEDPDESELLNNVRQGGMEPDWLFAYNELTGDISEVEKLLEQLSAMYAKHLLPSFGEKDTSALERDIRVYSRNLTKMLHDVEQKVRNVVKHSLDEESDDGKVEMMIRRNLQKKFAAPLQELSMSFRKKQKMYMDKLQDQRETFNLNKDSGMGTLVDISDERQDSNAFEGGLSQAQLLTVENASVLAEERTTELKRVTQNVNDLATLVNDIAALVVDQGTILDRVDYNLEEVKLSTNAAVRELRIANRYQRKRHALCCIVVLAIACGVMFMILVIKWTS